MPPIKVLANKLANKTFAFTGIFNNALLQQSKECIEAMGGNVVEDAAADLDYMVVGVLDYYIKTPQLLKAIELNETGKAHIEIMQEPRLGQILSPTPEELLALLPIAETKEIEFLNKLTQLRGPGQKVLVEMSLANLAFRNLSLLNADLFSADLRGSKFVNCDFSGADLRRAKLTRATFENCKLVKANLCDAMMITVKVQNSNLQCALFGDTNLRNASFTGSDLSNADFSGAKIRGATFENAVIDGAKFRLAKFDKTTEWPSSYVPPEAKWAGDGPHPGRISSHQTIPKIECFEDFLTQLYGTVDQKKLSKSLSMLKSDRFQLFSEVHSDSLHGVVKSQTDPKLFYSCYLADDGSFDCATQNLRPCGGLRHSLCKHALLLIIGLSKAEEIGFEKVFSWAKASMNYDKPCTNKELLTQVFLRYKRAEAGEIDWRPTETTPEDFYSF